MYLLIVPVLRGIENLNEIHSAECLEQSVILIGILIIVPLYAAEQKAAIREVVFTRKIPQWIILLIRIIMAVILLVFLTGVFAGIMMMKNCTFPYMSYVLGTGNFTTKIWLLGISILLVIATLIYVKKKKVC